METTVSVPTSPACRIPRDLVGDLEDGTRPFASLEYRECKVILLMSMPRLAFTTAGSCVQKAISLLGLPFCIHSGAFWEMDLDRGLVMAVEKGFDLALVVDYDSVFIPAQVVDLLNYMLDDPELFAVFGVQPRRENTEIMVSPAGECRHLSLAQQMSLELLPAVTGHFGLTVIRLPLLAQLPVPWLCSQPGPDGHWNEGRVDADIAFWNRAHAAGLRVVQANRVLVGHLQQVITWVNDEQKLAFQFVSNWQDKGAPRTVTLCPSSRKQKEKSDGKPDPVGGASG